MAKPQWMIYGANGYTGQLIAAEAVNRGHRPILVGRSADRVRPLADRLGLEWVAVPLEDAAGLKAAVQQVSAVMHAAGPYIYTAEPMLQACLGGITNYLDITGEIAVYDRVFQLDQAAYERGMALIPGVGFDVVPTDCLANYVAAQLPDATTLELAFDALGGISPGTSKTALEGILTSGLVRRDGQLEPWPLGGGARQVPFPSGQRWAMPIPWGDLATAYRSTGIPNITTYMVTTPSLARLARWTRPFHKLLVRPPFKGLSYWAIEQFIHGPDEQTRQQEHAAIWARVANASGQAVQAWLETAEAYQFTALAAVRAVEKVLEIRPRGALTPAQAFGADFVLEVPGTTRQDAPST